MKKKSGFAHDVFLDYVYITSATSTHILARENIWQLINTERPKLFLLEMSMLEQVISQITTSISPTHMPHCHLNKNLISYESQEIWIILRIIM